MKATLLILAFVAFGISVASAGAPKGTYLGTSKTTVQYLDPNTLQSVATQVFTCNETVVISALKKAGGVTESNPFSLSIVASKPKPAPVNGDVKAASARVFAGAQGGLVLLQYWALQNTTTGFVGQLENNHIFDGLARDRVIANLLGPQGTPAAFKMHDAEIGAGLQCTLAATVTGRAMALKITGYAFVPNQAIIRFTTKINARR
jgi:hypothetical protein